jgi:purine-cytosine permease-like protein
MEPTPPSRRTSDIPYFDMAAMWMSSNGVVGSMPTGLLGPVVFGLSFKASILIVIFVNSVYPNWSLCIYLDHIDC